MLESQFDIETEVRRALEREDFQLHYQPILDLSGGQLVGFEALLRWMHPGRGTVYPADFLPVAEDTGLIVPLMQWALLELGHQIARWQDALGKTVPVTVSMNISPYYMARRHLVHDINSIAAINNIGCHSFVVEVAESRIAEHEEVIARHLCRLGESGIGLTIDDFGTRMPPAINLSRLPIGTLKIDRSMIRALPSDAAKESLAAIMSLAHESGYQTIAKGIEKKDQLRTLLELGCEYGQGFYLSPALDQDAAYMMIAESVQLAENGRVDSARLRSFDLFGALDESDLNEVAQSCKELPVPADITVIRQGQVGNRIYFLEDGKVAVYKRAGEMNKLLATLDSPNVIGEMAIVDPERIRTADVKAVTPLRVISMPIPAFCSFLRRFPALENGFRQLRQKRMIRQTSWRAHATDAHALTL